jgi:hypothetical protein
MRVCQFRHDGNTGRQPSRAIRQEETTAILQAAVECYQA